MLLLEIMKHVHFLFSINQFSSKFPKFTNYELGISNYSVNSQESKTIDFGLLTIDSGLMILLLVSAGYQSRRVQLLGSSDRPVQENSGNHELKSGDA